MIITRGFTSNTIITRGYGVSIFVEYFKASCIFIKESINNMFYRDNQRTLFKKDC